MPAFMKLTDIDGEATASGPNVSDIQISKLMDSTSPSFGGSGDDILIGGATSYDQGSSAAPIGTGDLADWQDNYGTGGMASAAISKMHLIRHTTAGPAAADGNTYLGMTTVVDGGVNMLLGDGSVRNLRSDTAGPFFAYDQGFLGGVTVAAGDINGLDALVFEGDRYDPYEQAIGGLSIAVADIEAKGPHMLMNAGFMF